MPFKQITPMADVDRYNEESIISIEESITAGMVYVGERCLHEAKTGHTYLDREGNLTSSMGYMVLKSGKVVKMSDFSVVKNGGHGSKEGQSFIAGLIGKYPKGIVLVVVAGENHAAHVSAKGYNVLDSSDLLAEKFVPQLLIQLGFKKR